MSTTERSFENVVLPHLEAVYSMSRRLCRDEAEAEDLTQEVYLRALDAYAHFDLRDHGAKPWLLKILRNVHSTGRQQRRRQPTSLDERDFDDFFDGRDSVTGDHDGTTTMRWDQIDAELKAAVENLPDEYRTVLLMAAVEGLSYKELADRCGCPMGTVMSRLYRARQLLGRTLADYAIRHNVTNKRAES